MGSGVPQQPGVGQVNQYPGATVARAYRGKGLDAVVHFLRFGGRAGAALARDGQDMVGRCDSPAELLVDRIERVERQDFGQAEKDDALDDKLDPVFVIPYLLGVS